METFAFSGIFKNYFRDWPWKRTLRLTVGLLIALFPFILILIVGVPEELATASRYSYSLFLPITFFVLYFAYRQKGRFGKIVALSLTVTLFGIPLARLWHTGASESFLLGGLLPWSDAVLYYEAARSLIEGNLMASVQRPFFPGMLATLLTITGQNLEITVAILVAISGISVYLAAREIRKTLGTAAAVLIAIGLFLYYRAFTGEMMTETLGFSLGNLGFALIFRGARLKSESQTIAGLFLLAFGLNARVGTILVLPAIVIWGCFVFSEKKRFSWKFFLRSSLAVLLAFLMNVTLYKAICSEKTALPFSNYSYTLYGLLTQTNWQKVVEENPNLRELDEHQRNQEILRLALAKLKKNPISIVWGMLKAWRELCWGYFALFVCEGPNITGENPLIIVEPLLKLLSLIGLIVCFSTFRKLTSSLIVCSTAGFFLSGALVPIWDAGSRPYAATMIILYVLAASGFSFLVGIITGPIATRVRNSYKDGQLPRLVSFSIPVLGLCTFPFWYQRIQDSPVSVQLQMAAPGAEYARIYWDDPALHPESYQRITINPKKSLNWQVTIEALRKNNPLAKASQVWLTEVSTPEKRADLTTGKIIGQPWEYPHVAEFPWAAATGNQPQTLTLQIEGGELTVQFLRSLWSGFVRLKVNNHVKEFDLYEKSAVETVKFPPILPGDDLTREYDVTVPYSKWRKLLIVAEGDQDFRLQEVSTNGRQLVQSGKYLILPYVWGNRLNRSLVITIILFLIFFGFVQSASKTSDNKVAGKTTVSSFSPLHHPEVSTILGFLLVLLSFFGPLTIRVFSHARQLQKVDCYGLESYPYRINPGSSINLVSDHSIPNSELPNIRLSDFRRGLKTFSPWLIEDPEYFRNLGPSITIVDPRGYQWLLAETSMVPKVNGPVIACGTSKKIGQIWIFTATSIQRAKERK